ncbi:single-stranded-DNA-specific exonuclease RecJ [Rhodospirillaceae bacterium SYSU D60014]|uniref:single-stranded-DNA-specific exonuclease RecJ n=1 Tax=Virgifigura deserti TaxID=2268457 RepID=UPI000E674C1F
MDPSSSVGSPGSDPASVLGVERSVRGRRWRARLADARVGMALAQRLGLPELVGSLLAARGVTADEASLFLNPTLRALLPDPSQFKDMDLAVARLVRAVERGEGIAVFGDYDVDGATSSALLQRFFAAAGVPIRTYIPDRIAEGYGPNAPALLRLKAEGAAVVVTVDCGITAFAPLAAANAAGLDVIVLDHHVAEPQLPEAVAVVNPNRLDESGACRQLAAVGVTFLLVVALNRALRAAGWYRDGRAEPDLLQWLDLVALGTICDVVPLTGLNRALVAQGLRMMGRRGNPGLAALADAAGLTERAGAYHAGFVLGPRVNAGGRVGAADLGSRLLATDDAAEAAALAAQLEAFNGERRAIEQQVLAEAVARVEADSAPETSLVLAAGEGWHPGVIGIVASRLKERYARPAFVVALSDGIGKGSARSVPGVDLGNAVIAARQAGLLLNGGGHAMAAGFTVEAARLDEFQAFLAARLSEAAGSAGPVQPTLGLDGVLTPGAATPDFAGLLEQLGPFGAGNAEPRFAIPAARLVRADVVGEGHVRCIVTGPDGGRLKAIAFRCLESELGRALLQSGGVPIHLAGHLRADRWQGREGVQFLIEDAAPVYGAV